MGIGMSPHPGIYNIGRAGMNRKDKGTVGDAMGDLRGGGFDAV